MFLCTIMKTLYRKISILTFIDKLRSQTTRIRSGTEPNLQHKTNRSAPYPMSAPKKDAASESGLGPLGAVKKSRREPLYHRLLQMSLVS